MEEVKLINRCAVGMLAMTCGVVRGSWWILLVACVEMVFTVSTEVICVRYVLCWQ